MGTWSLIVVLLISSTASLERKCPSNILKKFLSDSKAKEHYQNGETISVTCPVDSDDSEYAYANYDTDLDTKDNSVVLNCTDGKWIGHYPECFKNCSKPDIYANLDPEYDLYAPGDNVRVTACKKDNARIEGDKTLICMADGNWIGSARCPKKQRSCNEQPPTIANAYIAAVVLDEYIHGTVLRYKCGQAFDQMGIHSVKCDDGRWIPDSSNLLQCIIGQCSPIDGRDIDNGRVKNIVGEVGTYAEFECYDGYELDGSARILCMADRKWHPEIPKCKPVSCPSPKQPLHGRLVQEAYNGVLNIYQSTIRYDCVKGYRMVGPQFRKCQADRTWSGNDTKCEEILCDKPSPPEYGQVHRTDNSEKVGSQIEYICDEHHIMEPITSQFAICTEQGHWSNPKPRCIKTCKVRALSHGSIRIGRLGRKITEDTYVPDNTELIFTSDDGYEMYAGSYDTDGKVKCFNGVLIPGPPESRPRRCLITSRIKVEYFKGARKVEGYVANGTVMEARCPNRMELVRSGEYLDIEHQSVICNMGTLDPGPLDCKEKRCKVSEIENGQFGNERVEISPGEMIQSGSKISVTCADGYELYNEIKNIYLELQRRDVICYQGSFNPEIPTCKPRRCLITSRVNAEYFKGARKVEGYVANGTVMEARCPNRMELVRSGEYLDIEHQSVICNMGTLDPGPLDCKEKRCKVSEIENGQFENERVDISPGGMIQSGSKISVTCADGYELYNEIKNIYLELQRRDVNCYQGSFNPEIPTCKPRRCLITSRVNAEYFKGARKVEGYVANGTVMEARCPNRMELVRSGEYLDIEHQSVICNMGTLDPGPLDCKEKRCKVSEIENGQFENERVEISPGGMIQSGSKISVTCADGYELYNEIKNIYLELQRRDVNCYQGSFNPEIPTCKPRRCLITSRVNAEYFKGARKVEGYVANGTVMEARCPNRMELVRSGEYLDIEHQSVICNMGTLDPGPLDCKEKRCKVSEIENGQFENERIEISPGEMIQSNSKISVTCADGYELYIETKNIYLEQQRRDVNCYQGSFNPEIPTCKPRRCLITSRVNAEYFKGARKVEGYVANGTVMEARCPNRMELVRSGEYLDIEHQSVICNMGTLDPGPLDCKEKRCKVSEIENGQFENERIEISPGEMIESSSKISVTCDDGYELYNETKNIYLEQQRRDLNCYQGSFNPEIPTCKPRRCLITSRVNAEYFKGARKVEGYVANGTVMEARCPNRMELVRSGEYLDIEHQSVICNMGTLDPGPLDCKEKRCQVPEIENGQLIKGRIKISPGEMISSSSKISVTCADGYELYNETKNIYLEQQRTNVMCYQGTFNPEIPTCKPKVCNEPPFKYLIIKNGTSVNKDRIFSLGTKLNASCDTSSTLHDDKRRGRNGTSAITECSYGEWEPNFSCKKTCTLPKGSFKYVNPKYQNETKKEGDQITHGRRMVPVCPSNHKEIKKSTCLNGTWVPSFEGCAKDIGRCSIPNDPGMQFTYIQNGTEVVDGHLEEGDKVVVSCKFGYEIDTPSGSEIGYEYDYSNDESTAYSVIVPKAKDSEKLGPISNGTYTCRETGKWEPEIRFTCKPITCRSLDDYGFENGRITYWLPGIYKVGTVASFTCNPGYRRDGPANRTCQEDGTWSGTCVTCQSDKRDSLTMCPAPCVPDWAKKTGSYIYDLGSRVEFQCFPTKMQYSGDSSNIRHCVNGNKSASWNGTLINCKGLRDVTLRMIADGVADVWGMLSEALGIHSNHMILADDNSSRKALDILQYWRDIVMRDKPKSLIPDLIIVMETLQKRDVAVALRSLNGLEYIRCKHPPLNGTVKPYQSDYLFGQSVRVSSCDDGYMLVNQGYLVCSEEGTWFGNSTCRHAICSPECGINEKCVRDNECRCSEGFSGKTCDEKVKSEVECESLPDNYTIIQNGVVQGKLSHQTVVEIICNNSQAPFDDYNRATCKKGVWDPWKPFCQNTCSLQSVPGTLYNYNISRDSVRPGPVSSGRKIKVTCEKEYIPVPQLSDVSTCVNGVWKPAITRCEKKVSCATPRILNVIVDPLKETYEVNENVSLTGCLNGLDLVGSKSLLCLKDGSWHGNAQCTSYCTNGVAQWKEKHLIEYNGNVLLNLRWHENKSDCLQECEANNDCRALHVRYKTGYYHCLLLRQNKKSNRKEFYIHSQGVIIERFCIDACVVSKDFDNISLYNGDSPYDGEKVQDGMVLFIKCKVPGLTAVPGHVTCMGGKWNHPIENISCLAKEPNV